MDEKEKLKSHIRVDLKEHVGQLRVDLLSLDTFRAATQIILWKAQSKVLPTLETPVTYFHLLFVPRGTYG